MEEKKKHLDTLKVAMVNYNNTLPFLYGLNRNFHNENLILDIPSRCKTYFDKDQTDAALIPIGTLSQSELKNIKTKYCIGCNGSVRTVVLFSNTPINEVTKVYLDAHSRTSQKLTKILCSEHWKIDPVYEELWIDGTPQLEYSEAILMIGDKVIPHEGIYQYTFDLGEEWKNMTGRSFPFAVWIFKDHVSDDLIKSFEQLLSIGINDIVSVIKEYKNQIIGNTPLNYYTTYIDYDFNDDKKESLSIYLDFADKLV